MSYRMVVLANRLPARRVVRDGVARWAPSPGGLVSALRPVLEEQGGAWVGWSGRPDDVPEPFDVAGIHCVPLAISGPEVEEFYEGFSNRALWPLYHDALRAPEYRRSWWRTYQRVNRRFAEQAARIAAPGATVWIHDYQLQLAPAVLRALRPDVRIGFFLHIPFPPIELFAQLPWREEILAGLLASDVVGLQTAAGAANLVRLAERFGRGTRDGDQRVRVEGAAGPRQVVVRAFPISIDVAQRERFASAPRCLRKAASLREALGRERRIVLGVDRLDYTKGIGQRLEAFRELLQSGRLSVDECVFVQVAVPTREQVQDYIDLRAEIEQIVGGINGEFGEIGQVAVHYLHRSLSAERLAAYYRAADVMCVTPLRDGMNLVAKEYVASRVDDTGVLVLSEFAGAAQELDGAILVNPHDLDGLELAIEHALAMPPEEARDRMASMRCALRGQDVHEWARAFLSALAEEPQPA